MRRVTFVFAITAVAAAGVLAPRLAHADEIADLEKTLNEQHESLTTTDCTMACEALGSIRRAADRICVLEPGPRCEAAQAKAKEDTQKVRDACPSCAIAAESTDQRKVVPGTASPVSEGQETSLQSAPSRGGCASCTTSGAGPSDLGVMAIGLLAMMRLLRVPRRDRDVARGARRSREVSRK